MKCASHKALLPLLCCIGIMSYAADMSWQYVHPPFDGADFNSILWTGERFIIAGENGTILTSDAHAALWQKIASSDTVSLNCMAIQGKTVVAAGENQTILLSTNAGLTWSTVQAKGRFDVIANPIITIAANDQCFVAGPDSASQGILYSENGRDWQTIALPRLDSITDWGCSLKQVIWSGRMFVGIGTASHNSCDGGLGKTARQESRSSCYDVYRDFICRSSDGLSWTIDFAGTRSPEVISLASNGTEIALLHANGTISVSTDAESWSDAGQMLSGGYRNLAFCNGTWMACGDSGSILAGASPAAMEKISTGAQYPYCAIAHSGAAYAAIGPNARISVSADMQSWTHVNTSAAVDFGAVCSDGTTLVASSAYGVPALYFSQDTGRTWNKVYSFDSPMAQWTAVDLTYACSQYRCTAWLSEPMAEGKPIILSSRDGTNWDLRYGSPSEPIGNIVSNGSSMLMVESMVVSGISVPCVIMRSTDGVAWEQVLCDTTVNGFRLSWTGKEYFVTSISSNYVSSDGIEWTPYPICYNDPYGATWNGEYYMIEHYGAESGLHEFARIADIRNCALQSDFADISEPFFSSHLLWDNERWIVNGNQSYYSSPDGMAWEPIALDSHYGGLNGVTLMGTVLVGVNSEGRCAVLGEAYDGRSKDLPTVVKPGVALRKAMLTISGNSIVASQEAAGNSRIDIYTMAGRKAAAVYSGHMSGSVTCALPSRSLPSGTYVIRFKSSGPAPAAASAVWINSAGR